MRLYETAFLIAPNLPEEEKEDLLKKMEDVVSKKKGKMHNVDNWGKKKLAYSINKFEDATYIFFLYEGTPDIPAELERRFKQTESIIRFLTVRKDPRDTIRKAGKRAKKKAKEVEDKTENEVLEEVVFEQQPEGDISTETEAEEVVIEEVKDEEGEKSEDGKEKQKNDKNEEEIK